MRKVRIKKLPFKMQNGGTSNVKANPELYRNSYMGYMDSKKTSVRKTLTSVNDGSENVEAEGGETVVGDFQNDGLTDFYNIEGPRHSDGPGVPLNLPESFIFSDTAKMKIKDPRILKLFGKKGGSYTPAKLSKQYQLNDYNAKLLDENTDKLEKETAELMISNNHDKLSKLAIVQEVLLKGEKVPSFAYPFLEKKGIDTSQFAAAEQDVDNLEGYSRGGYIPKARTGAGIVPYTKQQRTSTGVSNAYNRILAQDKEKLRKIGIDPDDPSLTNADYQRALYRYVQKNNPSAIEEMWTEYGPTNYKTTKDEAGFADGIWAGRSGYLLDRAFPPTAESRTPLEKIPSRRITEIPRGERSFSFPAPVASNNDEDDIEVDVDYGLYPGQPFFKSDMVDLYGAAASLFDGIDIPPTYSRTAPARTINPVLEDPTRAIANRQETAAQQMAGITAFGRNPSSAASYMQGTAAGDVANIISGVNQRNIGTLNQTQGFNAQMLTQYDRALQASDRQYDIDLATYLQQKHNSRAAKRNVFTDRLSKAYSNQSDINMINAQDPTYHYSTALNNMFFDKNNRGPSGRGTPTSGQMSQEEWSKLSPEEHEALSKWATYNNTISRAQNRNMFESTYDAQSRNNQARLNGDRRRKLGSSNK